jgi:hypothetical protein
MRLTMRRPSSWRAKERGMGTDESPKTRGAKELGSEYPTESHRELGLTHEQLLDEMSRRGEDPHEEAAFFDQVQADLRARQARSAGAPRPSFVAAGLPRAAISRAPILESRSDENSEQATASPTRPAELSDLFGDQNWAAIAIARVAGSAMVGEQIKDGDVVLVDTRRRPKDGEIALLHVAGRGQLVRRYRRDASGRERLEAANPAMPEIVIDDTARLTVHGVVVARAGRV